MFLVLAASLLEVTSQEALAAGTRILSAFGVFGPYTQTSLSHSTDRGPEEYVVGVEAGDGLRYEMHVFKQSGQCRLIDRAGWLSRERSPARPTDAKEVSSQIAKVEAALRRIYGNGAILPARAETSDAGDHVRAPLAVEGYPFIGDFPSQYSDLYFYEATLDSRSGALLEYEDRSSHPPIDSAKPTIDSVRAKSIAKNLLLVKAPKRRTQWYIDQWVDVDEAKYDRWHMGYDLTPRLGWFVANEAGRARLAWRIPFERRWRTKRDTTTAIHGRLYGLMIDAATGKPLTPLPTDAGTL